LDYSRVKIAAGARHKAWRCWLSLRMPWYEADAVRLARLKSKKMATQIKKANQKNVPFIVLKKIMQLAW